MASPTGTWSVSIVRYADDFVTGFESEVDARRMLADLNDTDPQEGRRANLQRARASVAR